ncbi:MAG: D-glycero-beta-D-manno-heptose-7-phosphate kinase [Acidiferrobacterales bacterium]
MLEKLLKKIADSRVLVVGDAMLDRYWYGGVERISPEAPVPVVAVGRCEELPGGAANVARNVRALGARCSLFAVSGDDSEADALQRLLGEGEIQCLLQRDKLVNTTVKLRVISQNQQLIRLDFDMPVSKDGRVRLLDAYLERLPEYQVVIISDYGKGGLGYIQEMIDAARRAGIPVVVDPKGDDYNGYRGADLVTPNRKEFEQVSGRFRNEKELEEKGRSMVESLELGAVLVTRGEQGMSLVRRNGEALHYAARAKEVFDVTGAGDTVIAAMGCAYAVAGEPGDALHLANVAAGIVVGKVGAASALPEEILHELALEER